MMRDSCPASITTRAGTSTTFPTLRRVCPVFNKKRVDPTRRMAGTIAKKTLLAVGHLYAATRKHRCGGLQRAWLSTGYPINKPLIVFGDGPDLVGATCAALVALDAELEKEKP